MLARAEKDLAAKKTEAAAYGRSVWKEIFPGVEAPASDRDVLAKLFARVSADRAKTVEEFVEDYRKQVADVNAFLHAHDVVTLPDPLTLFTDRSPGYFVGQSRRRRLRGRSLFARRPHALVPADAARRRHARGEGRLLPGFQPPLQRDDHAARDPAGALPAAEGRGAPSAQGPRALRRRRVRRGLGDLLASASCSTSAGAARSTGSRT